MWLLYCVYLVLMSFLFFYIGITWMRIDTKYKQHPIRWVVFVYALNGLVTNTLFDVPLLLQIVLCSLQMGGIFMGTQFQCVGLTGGIACGKSTVSSLLAENGFDIIDADQISRDVSPSPVFPVSFSSTPTPAIKTK